MLMPILLNGGEKKKSNVIGAWKLVAFTTVTDGEPKVMNISETENMSHLKIFSEKHVVFVGSRPDGSAVYGGGSYSLEGNKYKENITHHYVSGLEKTVWKANLEVKNDSLFLYWTRGGDGKLDMSNYFKESYIRAD